MAKSRDVIIEFLPCGAYVKVSAIDVATGIEASIVGDPLRGEAALEDLAMKKLDYVMDRRRAGRGGGKSGSARPQTPSRRKGLYV
ncbi:DUF6898 family protein [Algihabitans albus]|uniref:DUF6898 family protein n=1 Tax=Algihabitans albus TaxID=2164067 RepID=UPI000E5C9655|nr:hypothetical protein [Algihabitans albus]